MRKVELIIKRLLDFIISLFAFILLIPIILIIALAIKLDSKGPVIFKQKRLGLKGKPFDLYKFRTMVEGAEKIGSGLKITSAKDERITKVGKLLRRTSLDELPQLVNVIIGDMSLIGPRPPVTYHPYDGYDNYPNWAQKRFNMRPGISGLAQVKYRNSASWEERIKIDNMYIEKFSIKLDIVIILKTIKSVFEQKNIYG